MGKLIDSDKAIEVLSIEYRKSTTEEGELIAKIREQELRLKEADITYKEYTSLSYLCELNKEYLESKKQYSKGVSWARELIFELIKNSESL